MAVFVALSAACGQPTAATPREANCATYCTMALLYCSGRCTLYDSEASCERACAQFPRAAEATPGHGDSFECRLTNLLAAEKHPKIFCHNAAPDGGTRCID